MTKPKQTKARASITMPTCPHCQQAQGFTKNRGAYHTFEHESETIKLFHVTCKACEQVYTLREVWPIIADTAENA